jgi:tRNA threonylcarbamoyl adenosine modification protein (Sua5/YciO/YrdC/YwlC family)
MFLSECSTNSIKAAAQSIADGHLVAFPTETVYGLGADATNQSAVAKIYKAKGRPADHPLIVHIASIDAIGDWAEDISEYAINLARDFWPGPMTLIFKRSGLAKDFVTGNQETVGLRVPNQPIALALLKEFEKLGGKGIAAPSANRFGAVSPTTAQAVKDELADYLDEESDVILTYILWDIVQNRPIWRAVPQTVFFPEGTLVYNYDFTQSDVRLFLEGTVDFKSLENVWTQGQVFRIVVVPSDFPNSRIDFSNYEAVTKMLGITDSDFKKIEVKKKN